MCPRGLIDNHSLSDEQREGHSRGHKGKQNLLGGTCRLAATGGH